MVDKGERIFLLEVFVDNVHLENCKVSNELVKTCVRFKFLNYPFLEIMEDEYCKVPDESCNIKFQSGKSCLFSLRKNPQGSKKPPLNLHVIVVRMESEKSVDVGKTMINLSGSFTNLIQTSNQRVDNANPVSKIIKETYVLANDKNQTVGDITIFVRLSCFGKIIVTQFQMSGLESKSFLFKAVSDIRGKNFEGSGDAGGVFDSSLPQGKSQDQQGMSQAQSGIGSGMSPEVMGPGMYGPGIGQPGTMGPGMGGPGMIGPGMVGPGGMMSPVMGGSGMVQPGMMGGSGMGYPAMLSPGMGYPGMMGPGIGQPEMMGPGMGQPGMMGQGMSQPGMMGPGMGQPRMMGPGMGQQGMMGPGITPGTSQQVGELPEKSLQMGAMQPFGNVGPGPDQGGLDYQSFSATVNGHVLNIKVLRKPKRLKQPEAVFCQREESSSSSESEDEKPRKCTTGPCSPYSLCAPACPQHAKLNQQCPPDCPNACPPDRPIPRVPLCDCDVPIPPCLVCPPPPPCPPPKRKKDKKKSKKSKYPLDAGMYCRADCPLGFPKPPMLVPPSYPIPSIMGASPTSTGEPQNFLISMEPRRDYPPLVQPPKPTCITVRDTQYEDDDFGAKGGKKPTGKASKGKGKKGKK